MRILFLAPQPFFQERGTPIAVDLMLRALRDRGDRIDLLTFHLGEDRSYGNVTVRRISPLAAPASVPPGFSWRKIYCDLFLLRDAARLLRKERYDLIHAVEEAGFMAMMLGKLYRVPYVVDVDSSMSEQLLDQYAWLAPARKLLHWLETVPMRRAIAVVPMCEELAASARKYSPGLVHVLKDVSLVGEALEEPVEDLRGELGIEGPLLLYVGNLESYQGIDLLLESLARLHATHPRAELVIIGGSDAHVRKYRDKARALGIDGRVHLVGPRPLAALGSYLRQADLLVSPRIQGGNTPMKIYSYLDSGVAVVATALRTHTQVMTEDEAALAPPDPAGMAASMGALLDDPQERQRLARNARALIRREHSWATFCQRVDFIFGKLEGLLAPGR